MLSNKADASRAKAVKNADLVIEAIIESLKVKRDLFGHLDTKAKYMILWSGI
jgi:3-hydroxyacyl-CoA dehydrogenase